MSALHTAPDTAFDTASGRAFGRAFSPDGDPEPGPTSGDLSGNLPGSAPGDLLDDPSGTPAARLYSAVASSYDRSYAVPGHRRVYDQLAWEMVSALPRPGGAHVVDVGCGTGRWVSRFLAQGCLVTGIETAPGMIVELERLRAGPCFTLLRQPMEQVELADGSADLVLAMGSVQHVADPGAALRRFARWLRPGGHLCVYVDGLAALVLELLRRGEDVEALRRLHTRRGVFRQGDEATPLWLYDSASLLLDMSRAGLADLSCRGLAIGATAQGRDAFTRAMAADPDAVIGRERVLSADPALADCGLHLLAIGRKPKAG